MPDRPIHGDPVDLLGTWTVTGVGEGGRRGLHLDTTGLRLLGDRRPLLGDWRANSIGQFIAHVWGFTDRPEDRPGDDLAPGGPTRRGDDLAPGWLDGARGFRVEGGSRLLVDADGGVVARLVPGWQPGPRADASQAGSESPEAIEAFRRAAVHPAPLPGGLRPAAADALPGRWLPARDIAGPVEPFLQIDADGRWRGSDGCNAGSGRWIAGPGGAAMATMGPTTLVACFGDPTPLRFGTVRRAGFEGDLLVLVDPDGGELGRLRPGR